MEISQAIDVLTHELGKDKSEGSYYYSWQANIAMAFKDEFQRQYPHSSTGYLFDLHLIANNAAKNFLDTLCMQLPAKAPATVGEL